MKKNKYWGDFIPTFNNLSVVKKDLFAGFIVFLVALPLCLGIALASNAPLASGLLAGIIGGILVGFLSNSSTSVSGPAAGLTAVVAAQIIILGSFEAFLAALFVGGLIQIVLGFCRLGFISTYFPLSVIKGLLTAIGIILILKQIPHLVGWDDDAVGEMAFHQANNETTFSELQHLSSHLQSGALIVGLISLFILLFWTKINFLKKYSAYSMLAVVIAAVGINSALALFAPEWFVGTAHRVQVPESTTLAGLFSFLSFPDLQAFYRPEVYLAGFTIALVASLETLLNLGAVEQLDKRRRIASTNRELVAQGAGNAFLGLIGGIPITSVIVRSSVNIDVNNETKLSTIFHGFFLLISVAFLPQLLNQIPLSCLAAILIVIGLKLANYKVAKEIWDTGFNQFFPYMVTVMAIVFTDLLTGVVIGLLVGLCFVLYSNLNRPVQIIKEFHLSNTVYRIVLANQVSFLSKNKLMSTFNNFPSSSHVLIDATESDYIDGEIISFIKEFRDNKAKLSDIKLSFCGFKKKFKFEDLFLYHEHITPEIQQSLSPLSALGILQRGNDRVLAGKCLNRNLHRQIDATAKGQFPLGVILSCIDSRAPAEMVFDLGIGDIFSVRIAGNVISEKVLGSLEYACAVAGAKIIVVMGHTRCGAIAASLELFCNKQLTEHKNLNTLVRDIHSVINLHDLESHIPRRDDSRREDFEEHLVGLNVLHSIDGIKKSSQTLCDLERSGKIAIVGCVYDVKTGTVKYLTPVATEEITSDNDSIADFSYAEPAIS